jgi:hypothetical protein
MLSRINVKIEDYATKHYLKKIFKKGGKNFSFLWEAFEIMLEKINKLILKDGNNTITDDGDVLLCKLYFRSEQNKSAKDSGSRCLVVWHKNENLVKVLLVYSKDYIKGSHETVWWKKQLKSGYPEYSSLIGTI